MTATTKARPTQKTTEQESETQANDNASRQAQFFQDPHLLQKERHAGAGLRQQTDFGFARAHNSVVITSAEIIEAARTYPIVFSLEATPKPVAILGLDKENRFLDSTYRWDTQSYIPLAIRKYPFGLTFLQENNQFALCVDEASEHYMAEHPDRPFYIDGEASELCDEALTLCGAFQQQYAQTEQFGRYLEAADLLDARRIEITHQDGKTRQLEGFNILNPTKWERFAATNIGEWQQKGFAQLVFAILASQQNWKYLAAREARS